MHIKSRNIEIRYIYAELGLLIILGIGQYFGIAVLNMAVVFTLIGLYMLVPQKMCGDALFIAMPFFNMFTYKIGTTSLFYVLIIIYCVRYFCARRFRMQRDRLVFFLICCLFTITILNTVIWIKWALRFFLMVLLFNDTDMEQNLESMIKYTTVSTIFSSVIGYIMQINGKSIYTRSYVYIMGEGSSTRFAGLVGDSVFYGQFIAVLIAANLFLAYRNKQYRRFAYASSAVMAGFALLSISKTAILLVAVEITIYVCIQIRENAKNKTTVIKSVLLFGCVCGAVLGLYWYVLTHKDNFLVKSFITRFGSDDLWTGRTSIAETYLEWLSGNWRYWFSGMPYSVYTQGITMGNLLIKRTHNIFLETACLFGVIPGIIIIFSFVAYYCRQFVHHKASMMSYLPLIVLAASGVSLHGHFEWHYYFLCSIAFACAHSGIQKKGE